MGLSLVSWAQNPSLPKRRAVVTYYDTTAYPIRGTFRITENGSAVAKTLEFWIYDAKDREIYYVAQGIPVSQALAEFVDRMIDKEYTAYMMKHGNVLCKK